MRTHLANAVCDILGDSSYLILSVLEGLLIARSLHGDPKIMGKRCISFTAIAYQLQEGLQS